jgi:hypothetical protein
MSKARHDFGFLPFSVGVFGQPPRSIDGRAYPFLLVLAISVSHGGTSLYTTSSSLHVTSISILLPVLRDGDFT